MRSALNGEMDECGAQRNAIRIVPKATGYSSAAYASATQSKSMPRSVTEAVRTQIQPSKPKGEIIKITNSLSFFLPLLPNLIRGLRKGIPVYQVLKGVN